MSYNPETVNIAGYSVLGVTTLTSGLVAISDIPASISTTAGNNAITVAILTIATILVNGVLADRKSKRESAERMLAAEEATDRKVFEAKADADRKLIEAKADADHRIAGLEARIAIADQAEKANADVRHMKMDQIYTMLNRLFLHADEAGHAINVLIPAVQENAVRTGSATLDVVPVEPVFVSPLHK